MKTMTLSITRLMRGLTLISRALAFCSGMAVAALALIICIDIGARNLLRVSVQGSDELGGYVLALVGSLGLAHTLIQKGHPRVDLGFRFLPKIVHGPLHVLALAAMTAMAVFMAIHVWGELDKTLTFGTVTNTPLQTPLWVPQGLWFAGIVFFAVTAATATLHGLCLLFQSPSELSNQYGTTSVEEEVTAYIDPNSIKGESHVRD